MTKTLCIELADLEFSIKLEQTGQDKFTVTYGRQVDAGLSYGRAASELGAAIMHALACGSHLDNSEPGEERQVRTPGPTLRNAERAETALSHLLDDVYGSIDYGMPFTDPEHGFHESVKEACAVLGVEIEPHDRAGAGR